MKLSRLLKSDPTARIVRRPVGKDDGWDPDIAAIHYRSSEVTPGSLFVAMRGQQTDGHRFIGDAIARGAVAVVAAKGRETALDAGGDTGVVTAVDTRKALAALAARFYHDPSENLFLIGITGTNGKTTTAYLIEALLTDFGKKVGVISTINCRYPGRVYPNPLTTPESLDLQRMLREMADAGVTHVVMEVSSHGVALDRIHHCRFDMGIFTNLSQDHLDFHRDMASYWECKRRFFTNCLTDGPKAKHAMAVVNMDHPRGRELAGDLAALSVVKVGAGPTNDVFPDHVRFDEYGATGSLTFPDATVPFRSRLVGRYNLENILCACGAALGMGLSVEAIAKGLLSFAGVPGRLERVSGASARHVYVDYAHTPDALENVLATLRKAISGRLVCVFGCGGDRDRKKRPLMGRIAVLLSDLTVVTSDNPRTENPEAIIGDILEGIKSSSVPRHGAEELAAGITEQGYVVEPDRERAIRLGVIAARPGDTVLIAGKGHEDYQIMGKLTLHFDDREQARAALALVEGETIA